MAISKDWQWRVVMRLKKKYGRSKTKIEYYRTKEEAIKAANCEFGFSWISKSDYAEYVKSLQVEFNPGWELVESVVL